MDEVWERLSGTYLDPKHLKIQYLDPSGGILGGTPIREVV
jgi:hypothetical protein